MTESLLGWSFNKRDSFYETTAASATHSQAEYISSSSAVSYLICRGSSETVCDPSVCHVGWFESFVFCVLVVIIFHEAVQCIVFLWSKCQYNEPVIYFMFVTSEEITSLEKHYSVKCLFLLFFQLWLLSFVHLFCVFVAVFGGCASFLHTVTRCTTNQRLRIQFTRCTCVCCSPILLTNLKE